MPNVLTAGGAIVCSHGAKVIPAPPPQAKLLIDGQPALVQPSLAPGTVVPGTCPNNNPSLGLKACTTVTANAGMATKLVVDGKPVLLDTATGITDSTPPGTLKVTSAGQTKLTAS